jgi:GrpB-like predicted nucleotidyltransferase (UPF0157 family)
MKKIKVVPYDPIWKDEFQKAEKYFSDLLAEFNVEIKHVGSTSVAGLQAKPILDIDIIADSEELINKIIAVLAEAGYQHLGNLGIEGREAFRYDKSNPAVTWMQHNLYVCLNGCESLNNHLLLRNHLRTNQLSVLKYGSLKVRLAEEYPNDIDAYVEGKSDFIASILALEGMDEKVLADIRSANQKK